MPQGIDVITMCMTLCGYNLVARCRIEFLYCLLGLWAECCPRSAATNALACLLLAVSFNYIATIGLWQFEPAFLQLIGKFRETFFKVIFIYDIAMTLCLLNRHVGTLGRDAQEHHEQNEYVLKFFHHCKSTANV